MKPRSPESKRQPQDASGMSMQELFHLEAENQIALLTSGLIESEHAPASPVKLESLMRAAHSLKGAARIVNLSIVVQMAHALEDCFVAAQRGGFNSSLSLWIRCCTGLICWRRCVHWMKNLSRRGRNKKRQLLPRGARGFAPSTYRPVRHCRSS